MTVALSVAPPIHAATVIWTNQLGGAWTQAANWSPNQIPGSQDFAVITNQGTYAVTASAPIEISGLIFGSEGGSQTLALGTNACTINGGDPSIVAGGIVGGSTNLTLAAGRLQWTGGTLAGSGTMTIANGATLSIEAPAGVSVRLAGRTLRNDGRIEWKSGAWSTDSGAVIENRVGGLFLAQVSGTLAGTRRFTNAGRFRKEGSGTLTLTDQFHNQGVVEVATGSLDLSGGGQHSGLFTNLAGTTLALTAVAPSTHLLDPASAIAGPGSVRFGGIGANNVIAVAGRVEVRGTTTFGTDVLTTFTNATTSVISLGSNMTIRGGVELRTANPLALSRLDFTSGELRSHNTLTVSNRFVWNNATNFGPGLIVNLGALSINGTVGCLGGTLDNFGTVLWSAGHVYTTSNTTVINRAGATFEARFLPSASFAWIGSGILANAGTFLKSSSSGTCTLDAATTNAGSVNVLGGSLGFARDYVQTAGATVLNGGALASPVTRIQGGTLDGRGNLTGDLELTGGRLSLGGHAQPLSVSGSFTASNPAVLGVDFPGLVAGGNHLSVGGAAQLGGALEILNLVESYPVPANATFVLVAAQAAAGAFAPISYPSNLVGFEFRIDASNDYVCDVVNTRPVITPVPNGIIPESTPSTVTVQVTDQDLRPAAAFLQYQFLVAPAGAAFSGTSSNQIVWSPSEIQGPGSYPFTVMVWDNGVPSLSNTVSFTLTVQEVNVAPVIDPIAPWTIDEGTTNSFVVTAFDDDRPTNRVTFALEGNTYGATIGAGDRVADGRFATTFRWTPTMAQGGSNYAFTVLAIDNNPDDPDPSRQSLTNRQTFAVTVNNINLPPRFAAIPNQTVGESNEFRVRIRAFDTNVPPNNVTFEQLTGPANLTIASVLAGITNESDLVWTATEQEGPGVSNITVRAVGAPGIASTNQFTLTIEEVNIAPSWSAPIDVTLIEGVATNLSLVPFAYDPDIPTNSLTFLPVGNWSTGIATVSVSPDGQLAISSSEISGPNVLNLSVRASDGAASGTNTITIRFLERNEPPVITQGDLVFITGQLNARVIAATDPDLPANPLSYELLSLRSRDTVPIDALPSVTFGTNTGLLTWTPTAEQSAKIYDATVRVTDFNANDLLNPSLSTEGTFAVVVKSNNVPPLVALSTNGVEFFTSASTNVIATTNRIAERVPYRLHLAITDVDFPTNRLTLTISNAPAGLCLTNLQIASLCVPELGLTNISGTNVADPGGTLSTLEADLLWTPTETQGPTNLVIGLRVTDGAGAVSQTLLRLIVDEVDNAPPAWAFPLADASYTFNQSVNNYFPVLAVDEDIPSTNSYHARKVRGNNVDTDRNFEQIDGQTFWRWNPSGGGTRTITFTVTNAGVTAAVTFSGLVNNGNVGPIIYSPSNGFTANVDLGATVTVPILAVDPDGGSPANQNLTFTLLTTNSPAANFSSSGRTATFAWTPTTAQRTNVTVRVRDSSGNTSTVTFTIIARDPAVTNTPPVLVANTNLPPQVESQELILPLGVIDPDQADSMTFSLLAGPNGMAIEPIDSRNARLRWTPTEADGPTNVLVTLRVTDDGSPPQAQTITFPITVLESNAPPVLASPLPGYNVFAVCAGQTREVTLVMTNSDNTGDLISFSLDTGAPAGAAIISQTNQGPASAVISLDAAAAALGTTFEVRVIATDTNTAAAVLGNLAVTNSLYFVVVGTNNANPTFGLVSSQINFVELSPNSFVIPVNDTDSPTNVLTFTLLSAPGDATGLSLNPRTGELTWTPTEIQGRPQGYAITVQVEDDGCPVRTITTNLTVVVGEANAAPFFVSDTAGIIATNDVGGTNFLLNLEAGDFDLPLQTLDFTLTVAPAGATLTTADRTAVLRWVPTPDQVGGHPVTVTVTDNGPGNLTASQSFTLVAAGDPYVTAIPTTNATVILEIRATPGVTYEVQKATNLVDAVWIPVQTNTAALTPSYYTNSAAIGAGYFRIRVP